MAKPNYLLPFLGVLAFLTVACTATMYIVGDNGGWDISNDLDSWATGKRFIVGDVLMFQYSSPFSACELTKKGFDTCNTNDVILQLSAGNATFPLTKPGDYYFADCNRLYCLGGMKLKIHVGRNSTAAPVPIGAPIGAPIAAPGPASLLPRTSKTNTPVPTSSAEFIKVSGAFLLFLLGLVSYSILG